MLTIKRLIINNLGPYYGKQIIDFPNEGVTIIHGENECGKTSLYKILKYLFFKSPDVKNTDIDVDIYKLINLKAFEMNDNDYYTQIAFEFISKTNLKYNYTLRRSFEIKSNIQKIQSNEDIIEKISLRENDISCNVEKIYSKLSEFFPNEMRRFFMFDGVLLREYIDLVEGKGNTLLIKKAIEEILGMPILRLGSASLKDMQEKTDRDLQKLLKKNKLSKEIQRKFEEITESINKNEIDLQKLKSEYQNSTNRKNLLEESLSKNKDFQKIIEKKDNLMIKKKLLDSKISDTNEVLADSTSNIWLEILRSRVEENSRQFQKIISRNNELKLELDFIRIVKKIIKDDFFVKKKDLSEDTLKYFKDFIKQNTHRENEKFEFDDSNLNEVISLIQNKGKFAKELYLNNFNKKIEYEQDAISLQIQIDEILKETQYIDEKEQRNTGEQYQKILKLLSNFDKNITDLENKISEDKKKQKLAREQLSKFTDPDENLSIKNTLLTNLIDIFDSGTIAYIKKMRDNVKDRASIFYDKIKKQKDHTGLEITNNYGLHILTNMGRLPEKSGGAETAIAISLITSLHQNAAVKGPLIMDGPLQQMDKEFTGNVVEYLPDMSKQVIIMAFDKDINPSTVGQTLQDKLAKQYQINKKNSYESSIEIYNE